MARERGRETARQVAGRQRGRVRRRARKGDLREGGRQTEKRLFGGEIEGARGVCVCVCVLARTHESESGERHRDAAQARVCPIRVRA